MSSISNIIRHSLQGTQKLHLHKYCIHAKNRGCSSAVYVASRMILIRLSNNILYVALDVLYAKL